jgi:hypothetical protein
MNSPFCKEPLQKARCVNETDTISCRFLLEEEKNIMNSHENYCALLRCSECLHYTNGKSNIVMNIGI